MKRSVFFILFFLVFLAGPARAQFFIEQAKEVLSVSGGERINKFIVIDNMTPDSMDVRVYWEDFEYVAPFDGAKKFFPAGTAPRSASQWVQYVPQEFQLPAYGKQKVEYTIDVPRDIAGGHYGVLFFEKTEEPGKSPLGVKIVTRIGCLFFIESKDKVKKADISEIGFSGNDLIGSFVNAGDVVLIPRMTYYIMDESGMAVDRGELPGLYVAPQAVANWKSTVSADLKAGRYTFFLNADMGEGDLVVKEITFQKGPSGMVVETVQD